MKRIPLVVSLVVLSMASFARSQESGQTVSQPVATPAATTAPASPVAGTIALGVTGEFVPPAPRQLLPAIDESQVISRASVLQGGRTITLEHIQPPDLPQLSNIVRPAVPTLTLEEMAARRTAWLAERRAHPVVLLCMSGTIYDHKATLIRWRHGDEEYQAWSNLDFNILRGMFSVQVGNTTYHLLMLIGDESTAPRRTRSGLVIHPKSPVIPPLPDEPGFVVVQGDSSNDAALQIIRKLHELYMNNLDQFVAEHERRLRYQAAAQAWEKEHPPQPENITIRHWNMTPEQAAVLKGETQP